MSVAKLAFLSTLLFCAIWVVAQSAPAGGGPPAGSSGTAGQTQSPGTVTPPGSTATPTTPPPVPGANTTNSPTPGSSTKPSTINPNTTPGSYPQQFPLRTYAGYVGIDAECRSFQSKFIEPRFAKPKLIQPRFIVNVFAKPRQFDNSRDGAFNHPVPARDLDERNQWPAFAEIIRGNKLRPPSYADPTLSRVRFFRLNRAWPYWLIGRCRSIYPGMWNTDIARYFRPSDS